MLRNTTARPAPTSAIMAPNRTPRPAACSGPTQLPTASAPWWAATAPHAVSRPTSSTTALTTAPASATTTILDAHTRGRDGTKVSHVAREPLRNSAPQKEAAIRMRNSPAVALAPTVAVLVAASHVIGWG